MCLAIPHQITEIIDQNRAFAATGNIKLEVRTDLIEKITVGDSVLVHAGFAIEKLDQESSRELEDLWQEIRNFAGEV